MRIETWLDRLRFNKGLEQLTDLAGWRNYYFDLMLVFSLILLPIALAATLPSYIAQRHYEIIAYEIGIVLFLLITFFIRNPFPRGILFFLFFSSMILTFFISLGPFYARPGWLVLSSVTAALLFGAPAAMAITGFNALLLTILYFFIGPHLHSWAPVYLEPLSTWIIFVVNISLISLVASLPVSLLLSRLTISFSQEIDMRRKISQESEVLQEINHSLQKEITERKRIEEAIRASEERSRLIAENAKVVIWLMDMDLRYTYISPFIKHNLDYTPEEYVTIPLDKVLTPSSLELCMQMFGEELENEKRGDRDPSRSRTIEVEHIHRDGRIIWAEINMTFIRDAEGKAVGILGITKDITDHKKAEEILRESERRYRLLIEQAADGIFVVDTNGNYQLVNSTFCKMLGYTDGELLKLNVLDTYTDELRDIGRQRIARVTSGEILRFERPMKRKDGTIFQVEISVSSLDEGRQQGIIHDITQRKRAEEEKARLEAQLTQAQKMESIGTLAGGIAHDFNNILAAIIGYTELALDDASEPEKVKGDLKESLKAAERAKNLVSQILTFSRKSEVVFSPVALRTIVKESLRMLRSVIPTNIEIRENLNDSGLILANSTQIQQVMMNLCSNAAHAMDEAGGVLEVSLDKIAIEEPAAHTLDIAAGHYLMLSFSDTGHGIKPSILDRIFDPYFTTKELGRGTGLGLSVVHGIVKTHGGSVTCKSIPGKGTTFNVYLPELESGKELVEKLEERSSLSGNEQILFVDDEPALVDLAKKVLGKLGYTVVTSTSSIEALKLFQDGPDKFDIVITDMTMPGITGDRLAQKIMEVRHDIPIILCTGYSVHISEERARNIGIREFMQKPLEMKALAKTIRKVLGER